MLALAIVLVVWLAWQQARPEPLIVSGMVEIADVRLGSRVGGRVAAVRVDEGDRVARGDVLVELEPFDLKARLAEAEKALAAAEWRLNKLTAGFRPEQIAQAKAARDEAEAFLEELRNGPRQREIEAARAQVELAEAELENAKRVYQRTEALFAQKAADQNALDEAATRLKVAQATLEDRQARLRLLLDGTRPEQIAQAEARLRAAEATWQEMRNGYREEEIGEARANRDAAAAAVEAIRRQLAELRIVAPADGIVDAVDLWPGDLIAPAAPVVTLLLPDELRIRAYVPERLLRVEVGAPVVVTVASLPGRTFRGRVDFVAREAEFTPHNVQTPEDRAQLAYRIRVRLLEGHDSVRPGMIVDVHFEPDHTSQAGSARTTPPTGDLGRSSGGVGR